MVQVCFSVHGTKGAAFGTTIAGPVGGVIGGVGGSIIGGTIGRNAAENLFGFPKRPLPIPDYLEMGRSAADKTIQIKQKPLE